VLETAYYNMAVEAIKATSKDYAYRKTIVNRQKVENSTYYVSLWREIKREARTISRDTAITPHPLGTPPK